METVTDFIFLGSKITADDNCSHEIKRRLLLGRKAMANWQYIKKQRHYIADKGLFSQSYGFSSSHVWMWEVAWTQNNWCFWTMVLERKLESLLDSKDIQPTNPLGNQPWMFFGRTDAEAPIVEPPAVQDWLTGKDLDNGDNWRQKEKGVAENKMIR